MNTTLKNLNRLLKQNLINYFYEGNISHTTYIKNSLAISRLMAQRAAVEISQLSDTYSNLKHMQKRFSEQGVTITPMEKQLDELSEQKSLYRDILGMIGNILIDSLDEWQEHGATYDDLFNFCCCSENTINDMKKDIAEGYRLFSDLVCTHYPDCKTKLDYVDLNDYCPITHAVIEFMRNSVKKITDIDFEPSARDNARHQLSELLSSLIGCGLGEDVRFEVIEIPGDTDFSK